GEVVTAADAAELERALAILVPARGRIAAGKGPLTLYLTSDTVFRHRATIAGLPREATLHLVLGDETLRLYRLGRGPGQRQFIEV
ncbi:MAG TPA: hypothetical protein PK264_23750, partial [Hyphomicrobiaceae bacterium]|nr:hypothetical protein [Hyphomicrobiaceae bacterium]